MRLARADTLVVREPPLIAWRLVALFVVVLALATWSPLMVDALLGALVLWALRGRAASLQALELATVVKYMNPALVTYDTVSSALLWLVVFVAAARVWAAADGRAWRDLAPVASFLAVGAVLSMIASPAVEISIMKLVTFGLVVTTLVLGVGALDDDARARLQTWLTSLAITVAGCSAASVARPEIAYLVNGTGLQGVLNHPQGLGAFLAPVAALLLAQLVLLQRRARIPLLTAAGLVWAVMVLTEARTAVVAATCGVVAALLLRLHWGRTTPAQASTGRVLATIGLAALGLVVAGVATDAVGGAVNRFLLKHSGAENLGAAFHQSRGAGIESQWQNFVAAPLTGHGFGVYADGNFPSGVTRLWGVPISAPVEKGFVPAAVLEETGILGGCAFAWIVWSLWRRTSRTLDPARMALLVGALAVNLGEALMLAPGGLGLHIWLVLALASSTPGARAALASAGAGSRPAPLPVPRFTNVLP